MGNYYGLWQRLATKQEYQAFCIVVVLGYVGNDGLLTLQGREAEQCPCFFDAGKVVLARQPTTRPSGSGYRYYLIRALY